MTWRSDRLQKLTIGSPCTTAWDEMQGDGGRRFCEHCKRDVFDFEKMLPAEIERHLRATKGVLCARLTRRDGELLMAREPVPAIPARAQGWRFPALAAGLVTAAVSAGAAMAQSAPAAPAVSPGSPASPASDAAEPGHVQEPVKAAPGRATLRGTLRAVSGPVAGAVVTARNQLDDSERSTRTDAEGSFVFASVSPGIYWVEAVAQGWDIDATSAVVSGSDTQTVTMQANVSDPNGLVGVLSVPSYTMREIYEQSDLVVVATIGSSEAITRSEGLVRVGTTLHVETWLKGKSNERDVVYYHEETSWDNDAPWRKYYVSGTEVAAFLEPHKSERPAPARPLWESTQFTELRPLLAGAKEQFVERYRALGRLKAATERSGLDPAQLVEWLVTTAETSQVTHDGSDELLNNQRALEDFAQGENVPLNRAAADLIAMGRELRADGGKLSWTPNEALLGALLTPAQVERIKASFFRTESLAKVDYSLLKLVRPLDPERVDRWVLRELRSDKHQAGEDEELQYYHLAAMVELLGHDLVEQVPQVETNPVSEIGVLDPKDSPEVSAAKRRQLAEVVRKVRKDFETALAARLQAGR